jgi:hypothetical protein
MCQSGWGKGVVLSLQEEGCQHQGVNKPSNAFNACRQLANDKRKSERDNKNALHCSAVQWW